MMEIWICLFHTGPAYFVDFDLPTVLRALRNLLAMFTKDFKASCELSWIYVPVL